MLVPRRFYFHHMKLAYDVDDLLGQCNCMYVFTTNRTDIYVLRIIVWRAERKIKEGKNRIKNKKQSAHTQVGDVNALFDADVKIWYEFNGFKSKANNMMQHQTWLFRLQPLKCARCMLSAIRLHIVRRNKCRSGSWIGCENDKKRTFVLRVFVSLVEVEAGNKNCALARQKL